MRIHRLLIALALSAALAACGADTGPAPLRAEMAPAEQVALSVRMAPVEAAPLVGEARPVERQGLVGVAAPVQP